MSLPDPMLSGKAPDPEEQLKRLRSRDLQLWSIAFLTMMVLALGLLVVIFPNLQGAPRPVYVQFTYLPQLAAGLIALVVLLNLYLSSQQRRADELRTKLVRDAAVSEVLRQASVLDPLTQLLDRRYLEYVLPVEMSRANRTGVGFTLMLIEATSLESIRSRLGAEAVNQFLIEAARLLKNTFRGSDTLVRYDFNQFLVIMPATSERQAGIALKRLNEQVDEWNVRTQDPWEMLLEARMAACQPGTEVWSALRQAEKALSHDRAPAATRSGR